MWVNNNFRDKSNSNSGTSRKHLQKLIPLMGETKKTLQGWQFYAKMESTGECKAEAKQRWEALKGESVNAAALPNMYLKILKEVASKALAKEPKDQQKLYCLAAKYRMTDFLLDKIKGLDTLSPAQVNVVIRNHRRQRAQDALDRTIQGAIASISLQTGLYIWCKVIGPAPAQDGRMQYFRFDTASTLGMQTEQDYTTKADIVLDIANKASVNILDYAHSVYCE